MKKIVYLILIVSLTFLFNIGLYYFSDSYSFFLKNIKYWDDIITNDSKFITDDYLLKIDNQQSCECEKCEDTLKKQEDLEVLTPVINEVIKKQPEPEIDYSKDIQKVLLKFNPFYTLEEKKYDEYYKIFDITDEYPKKYFTYQEKKLELYFFGWWKFDEIYSLFDYLSVQDFISNKFTLNKINNFWKKSFFINLTTPDDFVRIVVDNENILFWLKIKKEYYNDIKEMLKNF